MNVQKTILLLQSKAGLTQSKIALSLGCHPSNISCFARGKHGSVRPSSKTVDGLRRLLAEQGLTELIEETK